MVDGSRGTIKVGRIRFADRACAPAGLSQQAVSGKAASHLRRALRDPCGLTAIGFIIALALVA